MFIEGPGHFFPALFFPGIISQKFHHLGNVLDIVFGTCLVGIVMLVIPRAILQVIDCGQCF